MGSDLSVVVALAAGLVSFLSPCVLPLIPVYITYLTGGVKAERETGFNWRLFKNAIGFILGFSFIFILLGASATVIGRFLLVNQVLFRKIAGIIIIFFGLQTLGLFQISLFQREWRPGLQKRGGFGGKRDLVKSFFLGLAFGFGWTPCVGPVLGSILAYASTAATVASGIWLLVWYSLGLAIPFLAIALTLDKFGKYYLPFLQRNFNKIKIFTGIFLILLGILVYFNWFSFLSAISF
ncbi:MAG: cytochrome c biogenesis protein CcdA [Firmicutes bacterium]|nr:cytochrome c biogenesis protein CcdA [Bacillota bacterium]